MSRTASRSSSFIGTDVSAASVHFAPRNGVQSIAYLRWKLDSTGLEVCRPSSSACR